jgi:hypothetical protein
MSAFAQGLSRNRHKYPVLLHIMDTVLSSADELSSDAQQNTQSNQLVTRTIAHRQRGRAAC